MKKSLKVVHIPFPKRNPYQKLLADGLKACGIDVKGAPVHHFKSISFLNLSLFSLLYKYWKPDVIHLHWQSSFLIVAGSRFKTRMKAFLFLFQLLIIKAIGIKLIWTVHNLKQHEDTYRDLEIHYTKKLAHFADKIIAHCPSAKMAIKELFNLKNPDKIIIIPHGNFVTYYPNEVDRSTAQRQLNIGSEKLTFLFLGEVRYYKGVLELIAAFNALPENTARLIIAGRPKSQKLTNEICQNIDGNKNIITRFKFIPDQDLQIYINASDVMVFPYRDILTSGGILLGMSYSKPIIAPRIGCIKDTIHSHSNCLLYDRTNPNGLYESINYALANGEKLKEIGIANRKIANQYDWLNIGAATAKLYSDTFKHK